MTGAAARSFPRARETRLCQITDFDWGKGCGFPRPRGREDRDSCGCQLRGGCSRRSPAWFPCIHTRIGLALEPGCHRQVAVMSCTCCRHLSPIRSWVKRPSSGRWASRIGTMRAPRWQGKDGRLRLQGWSRHRRIVILRRRIERSLAPTGRDADDRLRLALPRSMTAASFGNTPW